MCLLLRLLTLRRSGSCDQRYHLCCPELSCGVVWLTPIHIDRQGLHRCCNFQCFLTSILNGGALLEPAGVRLAGLI